MTSVGQETAVSAKILTAESIHFLSKLHRRFNRQRLLLLQQRQMRQQRIDEGEDPQFLTLTSGLRKDASWQVAVTPPDLQRRWVEITGPTERKMMINALNSGADVFMADFEDSNSPTWKNMLEGQQNLFDAVRGTLSYLSPEGKQYQLAKKTAVLMVRPRGWHLDETHFLVDGEPISASLFDFGLAFFHNAHALMDKGSGPYYYLPKLEGHLEARLWNEVFFWAQESLGIPQGTIRATVLLETILAAFEMEEILFELRDHSAGLNAGRWDYIFSIIKKFRNRPHLPFPDRGQIGMTVPFMRAYTELLVKTCHQRGAHVIGGMAAFIPSRKDPVVNEVALAKVREDKVRESADGFDGTWVAHPDLVSVAHEIFEKRLAGKAHQKERKRQEVNVSAWDLIQFRIPDGKITEAGVRQNISVTLKYLQAWLAGTGAVAINNLMEDAATAEISRAQLWQWIHSGEARLDNGTLITPDLYRRWAQEEAVGIAPAAKDLLDQLVLSDTFPEFLTLPAYPLLEKS